MLGSQARECVLSFLARRACSKWERFVERRKRETAQSLMAYNHYFYAFKRRGLRRLQKSVRFLQRQQAALQDIGVEMQRHKASQALRLWNKSAADRAKKRGIVKSVLR